MLGNIIAYRFSKCSPTDFTNRIAKVRPFIQKMSGLFFCSKTRKQGEGIMKVIIAIVLLVFIIAGFIFLQIKNKKK